jgi:hypothetical protein
MVVRRAGLLAGSQCFHAHTHVSSPAKLAQLPEARGKAPTFGEVFRRHTVNMEGLEYAIGGH